MRNYRPALAKWQTADPLGYPDGWNQLAYCGNGVTGAVDLMGAVAYAPKGLTDDELYQLNGTLRMWMLDASTVGYLAVWAQERTLTLSFLKRYMYSSGDQELDYSVISGETVIINSNEWVIEQVKSGNVLPSNYSIGGNEWTNRDLGYSIGGCLIHYDVQLKNGKYEITATINDPYDFHSSLAVTFPYLEFEGVLYNWKGGETVYDTWMRQLAEKKYAKVFHTQIKWTLTVEE